MTHKNSIITWVVGIALLLFPVIMLEGAWGDTASQSFNVQVAGVTKVQVSGNPGDLILDTINESTGDFDPDSDATTTMDWVTNRANYKLQAALGAAFPLSDASLKVSIANGLSSVGLAGTTAVDVSNALSRGASMSNGITYELSQTAAGTLPEEQAAASVTVTYTFASV